MLAAEDDLGTHYEDWNNGAFDDTTTGAASHGERDLGGHVPTNANVLTLRFEPGPGFVPAVDGRRTLVVDLALGRVIEGE
jgi:hypothetical protein